MLALLAAAVTAAVAAATTPSPIQVEVTDASGAPIAGAALEIWPGSPSVREPRRLTSDPGGHASIVRAGGDPFVILVRAVGLAPHAEVVRDDAASPLRVVLVRGSPVVATVLEATSRRPVGGAALEAYIAPIPVPVAAATTDASGRGVIDGLESADLEVRVRQKGYLLASRQLAAGEVGRRPLTFALEPGPVLEVRVHEGEGAPVADAWVELTCGTAEALLEGWSDADGRARFESALPCVRYDGVVRESDHRDLAIREAKPVGEPGGLQVVEVTLERTAVITGRVLDDADAPVGDAMVWAASWDVQARTSADGTFHLQGVVPGKVVLYARAEGLLPSRPFELLLPREGLSGVVLRLAPGRRIDGVVEDGARRPVPGARIHAYARAGAAEATSDGEGRFALTGVGEGRARLSVEARGFRNRSLDYEEGPLTIVLERGARISGRVVDQETSAPLVARVEAAGRASAGMDRERGGGAMSEADGSFELDGLAPGAYLVSAEAGGYLQSYGPEVRLAPGGSQEGVVIRLRRGVRLTGRVIAALDGAPVEGAAIFGATAEHTVVAQSDAAGAFSLEGISGGFIDIKIEHPRFATEELRGIDVRDAATRTLLVELHRYGAVHGVVVWGDDPVPVAAIQALDETAGTGPDGTFDIARLPAGIVNLQVSGAVGERYRSVEQEVAVLEGETTEVRIDLAGGGTRVRGVVTWGGRPLANAVVLLGESYANPETTDAAGAFVMPGVPAGPHLLVVMSGNQRFERRIAIPSAESFAMSIDFAASRLGGRIVDSRSGEGVPAELVAKAGVPPAAPVIRMSADPDGTFVMDGVPPGSVELLVTAPGYESMTETYAVSAGQQLDGLLISLPPSDAQRDVVGYVRLPDGRPAFPAVVELGRDGSFDQGGTTDPTGAFALAGVTPGRYDIVALMPSWGPGILRDVEVGDLPVEVTLAAPAALRVHVLRNQQPLVGAHVAVVDLLLPGYDQLTSAEGVVFFGDLPSGKRTVRVWSGADAREEVVELAEGVVADVNVTLGDPD